MQINSFNELPGFIKWFLVLAAIYLPVLICFLIMLQRESGSDLHDFLKPFNFGKRFGILKRSIASKSWLMRLCSWCLMFMLPLVYVIALVYLYFGMVTLDFGLSIWDSQRKQMGIPGNQAELQARYDQMTADENASARLQAILTQTRESDRTDLFRALASGGNRPVVAARLSGVEKKQLKDSVAPQRSLITELEELARREAPLKNPITFQGLETDLRHLAAVRNASQMLVLGVLDDLANPKPGYDPVPSLRASFMLARSLENEPILMSKVVQYAILGATVEGVELVLNNSSLLPLQLNQLRTELEWAAEHTSLTNALLGELVIGWGMFDLKGAALRELAQKRLPEVAEAVDWNSIDHRWRRERNADKFAFLQTMSSLRAQLDLPLAQRLPQLSSHQTMVESLLTKERFVAMLAVPNYEDVVLRESKIQGNLRSALVAVAIRQHEGAKQVTINDLSVLVPEYLAAVPADPFGGGGPMSHRTIPGWHLVYSVGINRQSESGMLADRRFKLAGDDSGVYVSSAIK